MPKYVSGIFLDFDNVYSSLFSHSKQVAKTFAQDPARWVQALRSMRGNEIEETSHDFRIRRCYMNPSGRVNGNGSFYSQFRQCFVRDGWEVIDTPPLTNQGKTSADTHIVMDVLDSVTAYPHVTEYVIMAADADYTPLVIRLRKHMKTTVIYAATATAVAYRAACDSVIDELSLIEILKDDGAPEPVPVPEPAPAISPEAVAEAVSAFFAEAKPGFRAPAAALGDILKEKFPAITPGWMGHASLSAMLRNLCKLRVEREGGDGQTLAWQEPYLVA